MKVRSREDRLRDVESIKNMMVARATGEVTTDNEYREIRARLIADAALRDRLPRWVHTCRTLDEFWGVIKPASSTYAGRRALIAKEFDGVLTLLEREESSPSDLTTGEALARLGNEHVREVWRKALERRSTDPEAAITSARTLLEAVCKHVLDERGGTYDDKTDLPQLYSAAASKLRLAPADHSEQIFKQILGGCHSVVQGLGALRNRHGDAHAPGKARVRPAARHAELAVNLAGTMATFLMATLEARERDAG